MRKALLFLLPLFLAAGEYITLENGEVIELMEDGTWRKVQVIKKGGQTIAIKPDGTWEKIEANRIEAANRLQTAADKKYKDDPLVRTLLGRWRGEEIEYRFDPQTAVMRIKEGNRYKTISGKWIVESVDPERKIVKINIGEGARLGFITFGGDLRTIRIVDANTIVDETDRISAKLYTLRRVR